MNHEMLVSKILENLSALPYVNAVVLIGSFAEPNKARFDEYSDIEILTFVTPGTSALADQDIQNINFWLNGEVVFIYYKDIAGWIGVTKDGIRFEVKFTQPEDKNYFLTKLKGPAPGAHQVLFKKPGFNIPLAPQPRYKILSKDELLYQIKDFLYMILHASQHFARNELWIPRKVIEVHVHKILLVLLKNISYQHQLLYPMDDRLELVVKWEDRAFLGTLATRYDKDEIRLALIKSVEILTSFVDKMKNNDIDATEELEALKSQLMPLVMKNLFKGALYNEEFNC
jgi:hypothetical protein